MVDPVAICFCYLKIQAMIVRTSLRSELQSSQGFPFQIGINDQSPGRSAWTLTSCGPSQEKKESAKVGGYTPKSLT